MKAYRAAWIGLAGAYAVLWIGGVLSYVVLDGPPDGAGWTAPTFLAAAAILAIACSRVSELPILLLAAVLGFAAEALGVAYGIPFGAYRYTDALFPRVLGVPVVMAAAWLVLFAYVRQMVRSPFAAAAWMTAIDLLIDPLAAGALGYWVWEGSGPYHGIPWSNFAGWFGVSLLLFALDRRRAIPSMRMQWLGLSVVLFFVVIAFAAGLVAAGSIGIGLIGLHALRAARTAGRGVR